MEGGGGGMNRVIRAERRRRKVARLHQAACVILHILRHLLDTFAGVGLDRGQETEANNRDIRIRAFHFPHSRHFD
jgi:hypothetical protein